MFWRNPVFAREFQHAAGARRSAIGAVAAAVALSLILWILWPRTGIFSTVNGDEVFSIFMELVLAVMVLLAPASSATAVTDERERRTFDLLLLSLLHPVEIGLGKLAANLLAALWPLTVVLPIIALCSWTGGISAALLAKACAIIAAAVIAYSFFGLAVSAVAKRNATALWVTYVGILILAGGVWLPSALAEPSSPLHNLWLRLRAFSPFEAMAALNWSEEYDVLMHGASSSSQVFAAYLKSMAAISVCSFLLYALYLFRGNQIHKRSKSSDSPDPSGENRRLAFPFYLIDPRRRQRPIGRYQNPIAVAELRTKVFGQPKFIARTISLCFVTSLFILLLVAREYGEHLDPQSVRWVSILFQLGVIVFLAPLVASGSISEERTSGTFLLLRLTLLPAWRIVIGKLKAAMIYVLVFLASSLPVLFTLAYLETRHAYWRVGAWVAILLLTTVLFISFSLLASSFAPNTATATIIGYGFALGISILPLGVFLLGERVSPTAAAAVLAFNPMAAAVQVASDHWLENLPRILGNRVWQNNLLFFAILSTAFLATAGARIHWLLRRRD